MQNQIVILAAGKGTRMNSENVPKVLIMLKNKPLILHLLEEVGKINQLLKPIIVVGFMADKVKTVLGDDYTYVVQHQQLGTGHALLAAVAHFNADNVLVLYGDMPFIKAESLKNLMRLHQQKKFSLSLITTTVTNFIGQFKPLEHFGRVIRDHTTPADAATPPILGGEWAQSPPSKGGVPTVGGGGGIAKLVEYKDATQEEKEVKELNPGIYMFNTRWLKNNLNKIKNNNAQKEYYLTDIVEVAIEQGININSVAIDPNEVIGINSPEDLQLAESLV